MAHLATPPKSKSPGNGRGQSGLLFRIAPGLRPLLAYRWADFRYDLVAGISVAAVALPVSVAYAELAGFSPEVGLYSSILPMVAYAIFGTSRQLIVNPDAATCAMVAASVAPLAGGDPGAYLSLTVMLGVFSGLFCIMASWCRLGALADFLSKPILVGFLNGIAISILLGQIGKVVGFSIEAGGIIPRLFEITGKLPQIHWASLAVGIGTFAVLFLSRRVLPRAPAPLIAMIMAGIAVSVLHLNDHGVPVLGKIPAGLPKIRIPHIDWALVPGLLADAAGLSLVLFSSGMLTARSFASKNQYEIDVDKEFAAFGMANIASAISQGFPVTGADSRTAMADAAGGRTQVTGLVAAASIAAILLFFTSPLQFVPIAALGAVLIFASFSLFDVHTLRYIWRIDRTEVVLAIITTLGVVAVGAINAILVAVGLALARFVRMTARPHDEILGSVHGIPGFHALDRHPSAVTIPGLLIYRFNSPVTFFNANFFKQRVLAAAEAAGTGLRWLVIDAIPVSHLDVMGLYVLRDVHLLLRDRGVKLALAGRRTEFLNWLRAAGLMRSDYEDIVFWTLSQAVEMYQRDSATPGKPDGATEVR
ncbi:MAG TPA: SulP family inorganic anion transporter [Phycisphaerae bacterium]|nr:SulP family inorganic anion transporter [Phycisphaerae bacterium]